MKEQTDAGETKPTTRLAQLKTAYRPPPSRAATVKSCAMRLLLSGIVLPYAVLLVIALFFSDALIFQPPPRTYRDGPEILKLKDASGATVAATYLPNPGATYTILFSHGNAGDIGDFEPDFRKLHDMGFAVLSYDYPGYGLSDGKPSEAGAYRAIDAAYAHLTKTMNVPAGSIIVMGHSLGGGVATDLAAREKVGGLILQSTFTSAFRVLTNYRILPFDKFNNIAKIGNVTCPILIAHGTNDEVIAYHHGQELFAAAHNPVTFHSAPGAGHDVLMDLNGKAYEKAVIDFAKTLGPPAK